MLAGRIRRDHVAADVKSALIRLETAAALCLAQAERDGDTAAAGLALAALTQCALWRDKTTEVPS